MAFASELYKNTELISEGSPLVLRIPHSLATIRRAVGQEPLPFILESTRPDPKISRWSIFAASPAETFCVKKDQVVIQNRNNRETHAIVPSWASRNRPGATALELLRMWVADRRQLTAHCNLKVVPGPFSDGLIGWFSYDFGRHLEKLPNLHQGDENWADCWLGHYKSFIVYDHKHSSAYLVVNPPSPVTRNRPDDESRHWLETLNRHEKQPVNLIWQGLKVQPKLSVETYCARIQKVLEYIRAGDIFQANFTHRFEALGIGDPLALYENLATISPAPFAAYARQGGNAIICSSPEWFYRVDGRDVITRPIKGTRPRGNTPEEDAANKSELLASLKDRAELTMIVDLERNDLGRVCEFGSVKVNHALTLESYAQVHHLVAEIEGRLRADCDDVDLLAAMFPGGSITGAPKIRAMEIIEELETDRRGVYTGAIGYIGFDGRSAWNIPIRTILKSDNHWSYNVGGGIVADSNPDDEYQETLTKGRGMKAALETPYP